MSMHEFQNLDDAAKLRSLADYIDPLGENHLISKALLRIAGRLQVMDTVELVLPQVEKPTKAGDEFMPRTDKLVSSRSKSKNLVDYRNSKGLLLVGWK